MTTLAAERHEPPSADAKVQPSAPSPDRLALILRTATLLFANAETTERTLRGANRVAESLGYRTTLIPRWDELTVRLENNGCYKIDVARVTPAGIDMNKVLATEKTIDSITDGRLAPDEAQTALAKIAELPPYVIGKIRFGGGGGRFCP